MATTEAKKFDVHDLASMTQSLSKDDTQALVGAIADRLKALGAPLTKAAAIHSVADAIDFVKGCSNVSFLQEVQQRIG